MSSNSLENEKIASQEILRLSHEPAPINLHIYQPPRYLRVNLGNKSATIFDITGKTNDSPGFNQKITEESYRPLITGGILANKNISWNLYGVTADWMSVYHPELISTLQSQIESGATPPVGDTHLHLIFPFLAREHKNMLLQISKRVYKERWGTDMETVWLPESAVDQDTLESLASEQIKGVLLREHQVHSNRAGNMFDINTKEGSILAITGHNYLSGIIGFDKPWADSFFNKWHRVSQEVGYAPRLSIDGETLGHWWKKDDGAFAFTKYLLQYLETGIDGRTLSHSPSSDLPMAAVRNNTSWSCMDNGVGRWQGSPDCYCGLPENRSDAQIIRNSKKDLFDKLTLASARIDNTLNEYLPDWRQIYIEWFMTQRINLATGSDISAKKLRDKTLEKLFISAYIRDLGWTSCGWFFGDVNGFERQIPANSLRAIASIQGWSDIIPNH